MKTFDKKYVNWIEALSLGSWALFFLFILMSGRLPLYINPRFSMLPALGAVMLAGMVLAVWSKAGRHNHGNQLDWAHLAWFLMPIVLGLLITPSALGAFIAGKRGGNLWSNSPGNSAIALNLASNSEYAPITISRLAGAGHITSGKVSVEGQLFSNGAGLGANECSLVHYKMVCCIADLRVIGVILHYPAGFHPVQGAWVRVQGKASRDARGVVIDVIEPIPEPNPPYLY